MKFEEIHSLVGHVPYISAKNARFLYDLILREKLSNLLELGIAHGTATCYMAAALQELGRGLLTSVDLIGVQENFRPSAEEQLARTGLAEFVKIVRMQTGYTWFLHDEIKRNTRDDICQEIYDFCIVDGPKNWTIDGAAFFFVDKLLKTNAWMVFDDYRWTYAAANGRRDSTDGITHRALSRDEQEIPHIAAVFELLVKQHPHYGNLLLLDGTDWALAQKTMSANKVYAIEYRHTAMAGVAKAVRKLHRMWNGRRKP